MVTSPFGLASVYSFQYLAFHGLLVGNCMIDLINFRLHTGCLSTSLNNISSSVFLLEI